MKSIANERECAGKSTVVADGGCAALAFQAAFQFPNDIIGLGAEDEPNIVEAVVRAFTEAEAPRPAVESAPALRFVVPVGTLHCGADAGGVLETAVRFPVFGAAAEDHYLRAGMGEVVRLSEHNGIGCCRCFLLFHTIIVDTVSLCLMIRAIQSCQSRVKLDAHAVADDEGLSHGCSPSARESRATRPCRGKSSSEESAPCIATIVCRRRCHEA